MVVKLSARQSPLKQLHAQGIYPEDNTALSHYIKCPESYRLRHMLDLIPRDAVPNFKLMFGVCGHRALEMWYPNKDREAARKAFRDSFHQYQEQPKLSLKTGKELATTYTVLVGLGLLELYFQHYEMENYTLLENEIVVCEEIAPDIFWSGRIDKVLQGRGDTIKFRDHKFSARPSQFVINPNPQFMGYTTLLQALTGCKVEGEVDIVVPKKKGTAADLLIREQVVFTETQMAAWLKSVCYHMAQIKHLRETVGPDNPWPQHWNCSVYRECEFLPLCASGNATAHQNIMASRYRVKAWDPFMEDL